MDLDCEYIRASGDPSRNKQLTKRREFAHRRILRDAARFDSADFFRGDDWDGWSRETGGRWSSDCPLQGWRPPPSPFSLWMPWAASTAIARMNWDGTGDAGGAGERCSSCASIRCASCASSSKGRSCRRRSRITSNRMAATGCDSVTELCSRFAGTVTIRRSERLSCVDTRWKLGLTVGQ
jgi:hypothetical protein